MTAKRPLLPALACLLLAAGAAFAQERPARPERVYVPIEDFDKIRRDELHWKGLVENDWVPAAPGALVTMMPVLQVNRLYETRYQMFVLAGFFRNDARKRAHHILADGRYLHLDANLRYFYDRYTKILEAVLMAAVHGEAGDSEAAYERMRADGLAAKAFSGEGAS